MTLRYQVWAIDQSDSPGKTFGGTLYIWDGHDLERRQGPGSHARAHRSRRDAATLCFGETGAYPVRPHMMAVNPSQSHAIISFVATGHVLFIEAGTRRPVECIRTSAGVGGARQAHMSIAVPDEAYVTVANQNGKLFERIRTDYGRTSSCWNPPRRSTSQTARRRTACPVSHRCCAPTTRRSVPITESTSRFTFVTLRGGGLFVVDSQATPMRIVAEYDQTTVHGNGCLGAQANGKMYIDSGGGTASNLYQADLYVFPLSEISTTPNPPNQPTPGVVFNESHMEHADAHGAAMARQDKFLWVADRGRNFLWVVDTHTDQIVNRIQLVNELSRSDPRPAVGVAQRESRVHVAARAHPADRRSAREHRDDARHRGRSR